MIFLIVDVVVKTHALMEYNLLEIHAAVNLNVINVHVVHNLPTQAGQNVHVHARILAYHKNLEFQIRAVAN